VSAESYLSPSVSRPRITDDDKDEITVTIDGRELRSWFYANNTERQLKMSKAWEYVAGWYDGVAHTSVSHSEDK
jgi:hypothetical protein